MTAAFSGCGPARRAARRVAWWTSVAFTVLLVVGNIVILTVSAGLQHWRPGAPVGAPVRGVAKLTVVDERVWRGAAPDLDGYRDLAAAGVTTVVDLRAERGVVQRHHELGALGLRVVALPVRDGQIPTATQVSTFLDVVGRSEGTVFLHCGAGVGRTGAMAAAYLTATGQLSGAQALLRNLAVGPPTVEQMMFAFRADRAGVAVPPSPVVALSRVLDAPRRIWHNLT